MRLKRAVSYLAPPLWGKVASIFMCQNDFLAKTAKDHACIRRWFGFLPRGVAYYVTESPNVSGDDRAAFHGCPPFPGAWGRLTSGPNFIIYQLSHLHRSLDTSPIAASS